MNKKFSVIISLLFILSMISIIKIDSVKAGSYDGADLAEAILVDPSTLVGSSYYDRDQDGCRQSVILTSLGTLMPTNGNSFILLSTGIAGATPITTYESNPGSERGTWFKNKFGQPRDSASLTLELQVPDGMHYLYYDVQFLSTEYPEYIGTQYNDKLTITVDSPSQGQSVYVIDVNSGDFILDSLDIPGTGFDIFAQSGNPHDVDWVDTNPRIPGADAGATALITREHPVSPYETVTVNFEIKDVGDNQFDSAAFIDNLLFSGYAKTEIIARKTVSDLNGGMPEVNDTLKYNIIISNIGSADQDNNPGNEFEDFIPNNSTYVAGSITSTSGIASYDEINNKIIWNGPVPAESSVSISFQVSINSTLVNGSIINNQGIVYWDSNEDGANDAEELTDNPSIDDGIDQDGDGETNDDDPTTIIVYSYEVPTTLIEDFSDDIPGGDAKDMYYTQEWFNTTSANLDDGNFEVASSYHYISAYSFKTKLRLSSGPQYWNYKLTEFSSSINSWEIWFACGDGSEEADLLLTFKNKDDNGVAKIKFEYVHEGTDELTDYVINMYYWSPSHGWMQLRSNYIGGYLHNDWYKLKLEKNLSKIEYSLYQNNVGLVDFISDDQLASSFSGLSKIEWSSTKEPVVCPMFFWDEHIIGLSQL